ncbi:MAG: hypothetical protein ACK5WX_01775 [bacterium]
MWKLVLRAARPCALDQRSERGEWISGSEFGVECTVDPTPRARLGTIDARNEVE